MLLAGLTDVNQPNGQSVRNGTVLLPADTFGSQALNFTGFTHGFGVGFSAGIGGSTVYAPMNFNWSAPELFTPPMAPVIPQAGSVSLACEWFNTGSAPAQFGASANDELCVLRMWVSPASAQHLCTRLGPYDMCCPQHALCSQL